MIYGRTSKEFKSNVRIHFYSRSSQRQTLYCGNQISKLSLDDSQSWHVQSPSQYTVTHVHGQASKGMGNSILEQKEREKSKPLSVN